MRALLARPALLAALVAGLAFGLPLVLGDVYLGLDHSRVLLPMLCAHQDGDGLTIDPALGGGGPLLEEPVGLTMYPPARLLGLVAGPETAASLFTWMHLVAAAAAAAVLARTFGGTRRRAAVTGLAWSWCGTVVNLILHGAFIVAAVGLPLLWAGTRLALRGRWSGALAITLGFSTLGLGGELQAVGMGLFVVGVEVVAAFVGHRRQGRRRQPMVPVAAGLLVGLAFVAVPVVLALGLREAAARAHGVGDPFAWGLGLAEAVGLVWPITVTAAADNGATLLAVVAGDPFIKPPWNTGPYLGLVVGLSFLAGARAVRQRTAVVVAAAGFVAALSQATPLFPLIVRLIPALSLFRYPSKYLVLASLAVTVVAVAGLERMSRSRRRTAFATACLVAAVASGLVAGTLFVDGAFAERAAAMATRAPIAGLPDLPHLVATRGLVASAMLLLTGALLLSPRRRLALVVPLLDLGLAASWALPVGPRLMEVPSDLSGLAGPSAQVCHGRSIGARRIDLPTEDLGVYGSVVVDWHDAKANTQQCGGPAAPDRYLPSAQGPTITLVERIDEEAGLLAPAIALGCTHLLSRAPRVGPGLAPVGERTLPFSARLHRIEAAAPAVGVVVQPTLHSTVDAAVAAVLAAETTGQLLAQLDRPGSHPPGLMLPGGVGAVVDGGFTTTTDAAFRVTGAPAVVVFRRPWWPGYAATDPAGHRLPVLRAAGVLLAVVVDEQHVGDTITIRYRVKGATGAAIVAALGLLGTLLLVARSIRTRGR